MIKNLYGVLFAEGEILFFNEYSGNVTFTTDAVGISCVKFNNINLHNANFYDNDPKTIIHVILLAGRHRYKQHKALKKISKGLMSVS